MSKKIKTFLVTNSCNDIVGMYKSITEAKKAVRLNDKQGAIHFFEGREFGKGVFLGKYALQAKSLVKFEECYRDSCKTVGAFELGYCDSCVDKYNIKNCTNFTLAQNDIELEDEEEERTDVES